MLVSSNAQDRPADLRKVVARAMLPCMNSIEGAALGELIRRAREEQGLTQGRVAKHLDVNAATVSRWEAGEVAPAGQNFVRLVELLAIDLNEAKAARSRQRRAVSPASGAETTRRIAGLETRLEGIERSLRRVEDAIFALPTRIAEAIGPPDGRG